MHGTCQQRSQDLAVLRAAFELVRQAVFVVDGHSECVVDANPAACEALELTLADLVGQSWTSLAARFPRTMLRVVDAERRCFVAVVDTTDSGPVDGRGIPRDALTDLANREALLARQLANAEGGQARRLGLLFIDLDGFKQVNDTWGHGAGDRVLKTIAQRLAESVRPDDLIVRYGGDEFIVLVEGMSRRRGLERLARRILRALQPPILVEGREIVLSASIGIAQCGRRAQSLDALIAEADRAMYRAKSQSRNAAASASLGRVVCHAE
jgi:diguanylate cyclase (GGDEF)-like protein